MIRRAALAAAVVAVALAACGSDSSDGDARGDPDRPRTRLEVSGVATTANGSAEPDPGRPGPIPDPTTAATVPFAGTLSCDGPRSTGSGMFATGAEPLCETVIARRGVFAEIASDVDRACAELYGGPQQARIEGVIAGQPVDLTVARNDGCGIADWEQLEFLLGPPER